MKMAVGHGMMLLGDAVGKLSWRKLGTGVRMLGTLGKSAILFVSCHWREHFASLCGVASSL